MPAHPTPLQLADYYALRHITALAVSPDGRRAAFALKAYRKPEDSSYQNLWLVETDGRTPPHRLTRVATDDEAPAFSPDGRCLAFLSTRPHETEVADALAEARPAGAPEQKAEPRPQIWVLDLAGGGEPRQLTWRNEGVSEFDWSPDGSRIVFAARAPTPAQQKYLESIRGNTKGPRIISRVQHKHDESGWLDDVRTHLFVVDVATRAVRQITDGPCDETGPRWSPDGQWIAFVSNRTGDPDNNRRHDLWLIRPDGSEVRRLTFGDVGTPMSDSLHPRWSPDSQHVAFLSSLDPENPYRLQHLCAVAVSDAEPVADLAACVGEGWSRIGGVVPDQVEGDPVTHARVYPVPLRRTRLAVLTAGLDRPVMDAAVWLDAETLVAPVGDRGQTRVVRCTLSGQAEVVFPADRMCTVELLDAAGGMAVAGIDRPETGLDLYALPAAALAAGTGEPVRLTALNAGVLAQRALARYERVEFRNSDGETVEALVALPPGFDPARGPAPLLAAIHGGPMGYDSPCFRFDRQYWAGRGYVVLMVNYRGSISYGEQFCTCIRSDWGPREQDDLMSGVDHLIRLGWADPDRLFCTGFSYGGIMTNWAVGHTDRFKAAASEHSVWDYVSAFGTDDCQLWWQDDLGVPWQSEELYRRCSPMSGVANIRTPLLVMGGDNDWRCALNQSEQLYMALKKRGIPTQLIVYQGERHQITRPRRAIDRLRRICRWLEAYGGLPLNDETAEGYPSPE